MLTKLGCHSLDGGTTGALRRKGFHRWPIAIITTLVVIVVQRGSQETIPNASSFISIAAGVTEPRAYAPEGTLADCISYWGAETHMSKAEWLAACRRTQNGTDPS
jgi:hypothetical protein